MDSTNHGPWQGAKPLGTRCKRSADIGIGIVPASTSNIDSLAKVAQVPSRGPSSSGSWMLLGCISLDFGSECECFGLAAQAVRPLQYLYILHANIYDT